VTKYDRKTFAPDGSAQLWAVAVWPAQGDEPAFMRVAPVVGWFDVTEYGVNYHTPAVHEINGDDARGAELLEEWAEHAATVELCHITQLGEVKHSLASSVIE
jgi:hypothetical protein